MRVNKFLMLGLAGLAFAACSNEEDALGGNPTLSGTGALTVKIESPAMTKASTDPVPGTGNVDKVKVTGTLSIVVECGGETLTHDIEINDGEAAQQTVTFWNLEDTPTKVTATMNGGLADYSEISINATEPAMQAHPESIPVYGEAVPQRTNEVKPGLKEGDDNNENVSGDGSDVKNNYVMYAATVELKIPVARLEVSGLKHIHEPGSECIFEGKELEVLGVYLDNLKLTDGAECSELRFPGDGSAGTNDVAETPLYTQFESPVNFLSGQELPGNGNVYGYNFYAGSSSDENPEFKVLLRVTEQVVAGEETKKQTSTRYAIINKYKDSEKKEIVLEKGHIYKITDAIVTSDGPIQPGEDGEDKYAIEVTVEEAEWDVDVVTAVWDDPTVSGQSETDGQGE